MKQIIKKRSTMVGNACVWLPDEKHTVLEPDECLIFPDISRSRVYTVMFGYDDKTDSTRLVEGFESKDAALRFVGDGYKVLSEFPDLYTGQQFIENISDYQI